MGSLPFALSVHHFISSVGTDAGFAAIIGLAILILLYFAQARETASLREHSEEAAARIHQLEARLAQVLQGESVPRGTNEAAAEAQQAQAQPARGAAAARPAVALAGGAAAASVMARAMAPSAPAGVAAPALTAATRLIPPAGAAAAPAQPAPAIAQAPAATNAAPAAVGAAAGSVAAATPAASAVGGGGPAPATVAGGANGSGRTPPLRPAPVGAVAHSQPANASRAPGQGAGSRRPGSTQTGLLAQDSSHSRVPRALVIGLGALLLAGVVAVLLIVISSSSSSSSGAQASTSSSGGHGAATAVDPAAVTVAVLNGTATNGLAHRIAGKLGAVGYKQGTDGNAPDQTHTSTVVAYLPGFKRDAQAVTKSLRLKPSAVRPVDQGTQAVACPGTTRCNANVVVTVGSDLALTQ